MLESRPASDLGVRPAISTCTVNVTEDALRAYIDLFHSTLEETAQQFLAQDTRAQLLHASLLPARIVGYVSTQFGAGIEYCPTDRTEIDIVRGSARVEDLFVQAPQRARDLEPIFRVPEGSGEFLNAGGVFRLTMERGFPFRLAGANSAFRFGEVAFRIGGWQRHVEYAEIFGNRTAAFWSTEQAIARAKDEVLAAMAQAKRAATRELPLPEYITKFKERTVLLLGDYDEQGLRRLRRIADLLAERGYDPILIKDIPDQPVQDIAQKVATIGSLSRFVFVDDSTKSGHLMEVQLCKSHSWITVLLRQDGIGGSWMTAGASIASNVILEQAYDSESPDSAIADSIEWAERKFAELERGFNATYPWRMRA